MSKNNSPSIIKTSSGASFGNGIGSSSLLVIFVILCLVSFATLSIVSANADYKLSTKVLNRTTAYYEACNQAELSLSQLDQTLSDIYRTSADADTYFAAVGHAKSFAIPISDLQSLEIEVEILYPTGSVNSFYRIRRWQVIITGKLDYTPNIELLGD